MTSVRKKVLPSHLQSLEIVTHSVEAGKDLKTARRNIKMNREGNEQ